MLVAAYCRVSTDREDQSNSFTSQCRYFSETIGNRPDWTLFRIYADEGLSGTGTEHRPAFLEMMEDARGGRFSLLLTKEVSRFSRNLLDTIACTRELKALGVSVHFLSDGICTADPDAELRLSIMASLAQEESRKTSARVKWGQQRRMEQGVVFGHSLLGYNLWNGELCPVPEEAELVRRIFRLYVQEGSSTAQVSEYLQRENVSLSPSHIARILKNEKYVGDLIQKKSITLDYLSHKKLCNRGQEELVILRDHHPPIVSRDLWERVQELRRQRARRGSNAKQALSPFQGKLFCGLCEHTLNAKQRQLKSGAMRYWRCPHCGISSSVREDQIDEMLRLAWDGLAPDKAFPDTAPSLLEKLLLFPGRAILSLNKLPMEWIFQI